MTESISQKPYCLTKEELTMPEGMSHKDNLAWVDQKAEHQIEGIRQGFPPQIPYMHPRYMARWRRVISEYNKRNYFSLDGLGKGEGSERHSPKRIASSD